MFQLRELLTLKCRYDMYSRIKIFMIYIGELAGYIEKKINFIFKKKKHSYMCVYGGIYNYINILFAFPPHTQRCCFLYLIIFFFWRRGNGGKGPRVAM